MAGQFEGGLMADDLDYQARIDELVSSALKDQAREKRTMIEAVHGARSALTRAEQELSALKTLVSERERSVVDLLETRLAGVGTQSSIDNISLLLDEVAKKADPTRVLEMQSVFAERVAEQVKSVLDSLSDGFKAIISRIDSAEEASAGDIDTAQEAITDHVTSTAVDMRSQLVDVVRQGFSATDIRLSALSATTSEAIQTANARAFDRLKQLKDLLESLETSVAELPNRIDDHLDEARAAQEVRGAAVARHVEQIRTMIESGEQTRNSAMGQQVETLRQIVDSQRPLVTETIDQAVSPFIREIHVLNERVRQTNKRISESNARVEAMSESLVAYLALRDERLETMRGQIIVDLLEHLGDGLKHKDRVRLVDGMRDAQQRRRDRKDAERFRKMNDEFKKPTDEQLATVEVEMEVAPSVAPPDNREVDEVPAEPAKETKSQPKSSPPKANVKEAKAQPQVRKSNPQRPPKLRSVKTPTSKATSKDPVKKDGKSGSRKRAV